MLGSLTKAFTATTVGELVSEGKMDWDTTPVNTYLPEFETIDPVLTSQLTMQDLLSHRTVRIAIGITTLYILNTWVTKAISCSCLLFTFQTFPSLDISWLWGNESRRDLIKRIRHVPVDSKLRATTNYNNVMYAVAGEAAANAAGVPIEKLVRNKIFRPLGLTNTGFSMHELSGNLNYALPYTTTTFNDAVAGQFIELPLDGASQKYAAAGDMYSSVLDLAQWGQVVMKEGVHNGKQVLSKEGIAATVTAHTIYKGAVRDPDAGLSLLYGMGWTLNSYKGNNFYEHSKMTHSNHVLCIVIEIGQIIPILLLLFWIHWQIDGRVFGYITNLAVFPNAELVVAVLSNSDMTSLPDFVSRQAADEILGLRRSQDWLAVTAIRATVAFYDFIGGITNGKFPERIPNRPPAHELRAYAGEYIHPGYGTITVRLEGSELLVTLEAFKGVLTHYHYDSFTTVFQHTGLKFGRLITFQTASDGKVSSASVDAIGSKELFAKRQARS